MWPMLVQCYFVKLREFRIYLRYFVNSLIAPGGSAGLRAPYKNEESLHTRIEGRNEKLQAGVAERK